MGGMVLVLVWIGGLCLLALETRLNRLEGELNLERIESVPVAPWSWGDYRDKYPRPPVEGLPK